MSQFIYLTLQKKTKINSSLCCALNPGEIKPSFAECRKSTLYCEESNLTLSANHAARVPSISGIFYSEVDEQVNEEDIKLQDELK